MRVDEIFESVAARSVNDLIDLGIDIHGDIGKPFHVMINDRRLTSLEGCPQEVGGSFWCYSNALRSLEHGPTKVGGNYFCSDNPIAALDGVAAEIGAGFNANKTQIRSLKDIHKMIKRCVGLAFELTPIEESVLGALLIEDLELVTFAPRLEQKEVTKIMNPYLKRGDKYDGGSRARIIHCQSELIDGGFEEFAKL